MMTSKRKKQIYVILVQNMKHLFEENTSELSPPSYPDQTNHSWQSMHNRC